MVQTGGQDVQLQELADFVSMLECFSGDLKYDEESDPITGEVSDEPLLRGRLFQIRIDFLPLEDRLVITATVNGGFFCYHLC